MAQPISGSCLCEKVKFQISEPFLQFYLCHCSRCQKSSGSAHAANIFVEPESIKWISGKELTKAYVLSNCSSFNKSFCVECGSPTPVKAKSGEFVIVPAGALNEVPVMKLQRNIFWKDRAQWFEEGCNAIKYEEYPP